MAIIDQADKNTLATLINDDGERIIEALFRYAERMDENAKSLLAEAEAGHEPNGGREAPLLRGSVLADLAATMTEQADNGRRIAERLSALIHGGVEGDDDAEAE